MDASSRDRFIRLWEDYVPGAGLPIALYYTEDGSTAERPQEHRCLISQLTPVRNGHARCFDVGCIGCPGGKRYLGFSREIMPNFEYFLSCGIPGQFEGERYKKTPEIVKEAMSRLPGFEAPAPYVVFKRWDLLEEEDEPEVVIFYAKPDVLSALFTLASFDETEPDAVITPFGAGCASIVQYPYLEGKRERPRAVLGMFDVSARPFVPKDRLSFAVPRTKFDRMVDNMEESFLITPSWDLVRGRI